ncbi:Tripartite motif-containing protein 6 [Holothuria leucospilota]|uniref:Tripartite motif-containing protein 6 n=1 Tax=Holothuria leucospilota TaxID=206669 RepID=A0A9Q1HJN6_HOLLE|nr:Tripartite motif-containing protein 6 [Holothuria leucospilota]
MATAERLSVSDCPICYEVYQNPKIISCGHSFCLKPCLYNLIQSGSPNCPLCKTAIQVPSSGKAEDLPTNFALQSMIEATAKIDVSSASQASSELTKSIKQKRCVTHGKDFVVYCKVCSELLCQKYQDEIHDHSHDIMKVQKIADKYKDSKKRCRMEADSVRVKIDEATESAIQLVRERKRELCFEVDKQEGTRMKRLEEVEEKGAELSLTSDYIHGMCERLRAELIQLEFKRKCAVDSVSKKTATLLKDVYDQEKEAMGDQECIVFKPCNPLTCILLGELVDKFNGDELRLSLSKLKDVSFHVPYNHSYKGCVLLTENSLAFLCQEGSSLRITFRTGQSSQGLNSVNVLGNISNLSSILINNLTKFLILSNSQTVLYVSLNDNDKSISIASSITLSNTLLYHLSAVTWDELGENCYALLSDGVTIIMFSFSPVKKETVNVRLEKKVQCSNSRGFHVSQFGMTICEDGKGEVRFYETTKSPRTMCVITAPSGITGGRPVCALSQKNDKKWYVLWTRSYPTASSRIYQYSASFEEECILLEIPSSQLVSFSFLDEKYLAIDQCYYDYGRLTSLFPSSKDPPAVSVSVSVYHIQRSIASL